MVRFVVNFLDDCRPGLARLGILSMLWFVLGLGATDSWWMAVIAGLMLPTAVVLYVALLYMDKQLVRRFNAEWKTIQERRKFPPL